MIEYVCLKKKSFCLYKSLHFIYLGLVRDIVEIALYYQQQSPGVVAEDAKPHLVNYSNVCYHAWLRQATLF